MVHFKINGEDVETLDEVHCAAVVRYLDRIGSQQCANPQTRALAAGGDVDWQRLFEELDALARGGAPEDIAQMLGNIRNDVLRTVRGHGGLGAAE